MNLYEKIKRDGIRRTFKDIYEYQIDKLFIKILKVLFKNKPLQNVIVIESHNDFDCNGGALYDYLIANHYNKKIKIIWVLKHKKPRRSLPENVKCFYEYKPSILKCYYYWVSKWFSYDQNCRPKLREGQKSLYCAHGSPSLKDVTGLMVFPDDLDYCLTASEYFAPYNAKMYLWKYPNKKFRICGFPAHDIFYSNASGDLSRVVKKGDNKVILWMPTFRKGLCGRNDSSKIQELGIPLIESLDVYEEINRYLASKKIILIIKIHPKQDESSIKIRSMSNIIILDGKSVKDKKINIYKLMKDVDALISDYSSAVNEFLHINKPIAYDFSDIESYTRGIIVNDLSGWIAGTVIRNYDDFISFINDIAEGNDIYRNERQILFKKLFKYHDGNSSKRVVDLLEIDKELKERV